MSSTDWTPLLNQATVSEILMNATMAPGFVPPEGYFTYGFHALVSLPKFRGLICDVTNFNPLAASKGGSISAYLRKDTPHSGVCTYAPMLFFINGNDLAAGTTPQAYILGLSEGAPYYITFKKGLLTDGLKTSDAYVHKGSTGYASAQWLGLRLDFIYNPQGDLVFNIYLDADTLPTAPDWQRPAGLPAAIVDDNLGKLMGSVPLTGQFYIGFGMYSAVEGAFGVFDYIRVQRQLTP